MLGPTRSCGFSNARTSANHGARFCVGRCNGGLGNNSPTTGPTSTSRTPVDVIGLGAGSGTKAVAVGLDHVCALSNAGGLKCWGSNNQGVMANPALPRTVTSPVAIGSLAPVANFASGRDFACATDTVRTCSGRLAVTRTSILICQWDRLKNSSRL